VFFSQQSSLSSFANFGRVAVACLFVTLSVLPPHQQQQRQQQQQHQHQQQQQQQKDSMQIMT